MNYVRVNGDVTDLIDCKTGRLSRDLGDAKVYLQVFERTPDFEKLCEKVAKRFYTNCKRESLNKFLKEFGIPFIEKYNCGNIVEINKVWDYSETFDMFFIMCTLSSGAKCFLWVDSTGEYDCMIADQHAYVGRHAVGGGRIYNRVFKTNQFNEEDLYFMYRLVGNNVVISRLVDFSRVYAGVIAGGI